MAVANTSKADWAMSSVALRSQRRVKGLINIVFSGMGRFLITWHGLAQGRTWIIGLTQKIFRGLGRFMSTWQGLTQDAPWASRSRWRGILRGIF
jgi:hypothetical protein